MCEPMLANVSLGNGSGLCDWVLLNAQLCRGGGSLDYAKLLYCTVDGQKWLAVVGCVALLLCLFALLSTAAERFFCPNLATLASLLRMNDNIAGVTLLAFGNGAPDIFASLAAVLGSETPKPGLAFGALLGSGMFLSSFVAGLVCLTSPSPFLVLRRPLLRDALFYLAALAGVTAILMDGRIRLGETIAFLCLYVAYAATVLLGRWLRVRWKQARGAASAYRGYIFDDSAVETSVANSVPLELPSARPSIAAVQWEDSDDTVLFLKPTLGDWLSAQASALLLALKPWAGSWAKLALPSKALAVLRAPLHLLLRLTIPVVEPEEASWCQPLAAAQALVLPSAVVVLAGESGAAVAGMPAVGVALLAGGALGGAVMATTSMQRAPRFHKTAPNSINLSHDATPWIEAVSLLGFGTSMLWIYAVASEVVALVSALGSLLSLSEDALGASVVAWANCVGDLAANLAVARAGKPRMALAACFAGPLFNLLVGFGVPFTIGAAKGRLPAVHFPLVRRLLIGALAGSVALSLAGLAAAKFRATKLHGLVMIAVYLIFVLFVMLVERRVLG